MVPNRIFLSGFSCYIVKFPGGLVSNGVSKSFWVFSPCSDSAIGVARKVIVNVFLKGTNKFLFLQ